MDGDSMARIKDYTLAAIIFLCGTFLVTNAYDWALTPRHLIWCVGTIVLVFCTEIRTSKALCTSKAHLWLVAYLCAVLLSGFFAVNHSEWLYWTLKAFLFVVYILVADIDKKLLTKTMLLLGLVFMVYFWYDYMKSGSFSQSGGLMRQRNFWASAQFCVIPFCYYAIQNKIWKKVAMIVLPMMAMNIVLLGSRSGLLALIVAYIIVLITNKKLRWYLAGFGFVSIILLGFYKGSAITDVTSLQSRFVQWKPTLLMFFEKSYGVGVGNFRIQFPRYAPGINYPEAYSRLSFNHPHNDFLWIATETGLYGIICYMGMFVTALYYACKKKMTFLVIALSGYMAMSCFIAQRERPFTSLMLATFIAMAFEKKHLIKYRQHFLKCRQHLIKCRQVILVVLIFTTVVFGYRFRASCYDKQLRRTRAERWNKIIDKTQGYSVFSTLTYDGIPYYWWRGVANLKLDNRELAFKQFHKAFKHNPYNVHVTNSMGIACLIIGDNKQAEDYFKRALAICPDFKDAKMILENLKGEDNRNENKHRELGNDKSRRGDIHRR